MTENRAVFLHDRLAPERPTRIVDIGANPLDTPPYADLLDKGLCQVWGFEPQKDAFDKLVATARENETYLPYALGGGTPENLHVCIASGFTSLLPPNRDFIDLMGRWPRGMRVKQVIPIETHKLDDIDELPPCDLLKIDVQGSEAGIFRHGRTKLESALGVISEVAMIPLYEGQPLLDAQMTELASQGFRFHKFLFLKSFSVKVARSERLRPRRVRSQAVDGDAVFLRDLFEIRDFPTERLKHLAILADSVFQSYDVTLLALDILVERGAVGEDIIDAYIDQLPPEMLMPVDK